MKVIASYKLKLFYENYPYAEQHIKTWYHDMVNVNWTKHEDVIKYTNYATVIDSNLLVFNILDCNIVTLFYPEKQALIIIDIVSHVEYEKLIHSIFNKSKLFPLFFLLTKSVSNFKHITTDKKYKNAIKKLEKILLYSMDSKYSNYTQNLCSLIHAYESNNWEIAKPHPIEAVKIRMFLK
jgi:mRNA interferase HigB